MTSTVRVLTQRYEGMLVYRLEVNGRLEAARTDRPWTDEELAELRKCFERS